MKKSLFEINIPDINELFSNFMSYRSIEEYVCGELYLYKDPVESIDVVATKLKNKFGLVATLASMCQEKSMFYFNDLTIPIAYLTKSTQYKFEVVNKKKVYILNQLGGKDMVIRNIAGDIKIGFGSREAGMKEIKSLDNFQAILERFADLIKLLMRGLCIERSLRIPRETLVLVPDALLAAEEEDFLNKIEPDDTTRVSKRTNAKQDKAVVSPEKPDYAFKYVGGQTKAKAEVMAVAQSMKYPEVYLRWGAKPAKGVLLWGPPGTGKTVLVRALASEIDANFYNIKLSQIFSMWYGQSSQNIQAIFDAAKALVESSGKQSVIFFDEIDALVGQREGSHEESQRVIQVILTNLDGLEPSTGVTVVAATNRKESIDASFLRPGRIDRLVEVPLPDAIGREEIFHVHMDMSEVLADTELFIRTDFDWPQIARRTEGMNGAEIAEIVRRCLEDKAKQEIAGAQPGLVHNVDIMKQITNYEKRSLVKERIGFSMTAS